MKLRAWSPSTFPAVLGVMAIAAVSAEAMPGCGGSNFAGVGPDTDAGSAPEGGPADSTDGGKPLGDGGPSVDPDARDAADDANPPPVPPPPGCDPKLDAKDSLACVSDAYGVFVNAATGANTNAGTKASPVKTLGAAVAKAAASSLPRVYVCEGVYPESITFDGSHDGISLFGGWACADWSYNGARARIRPAAPGPVVTFNRTLRSVSLVDVEMTAASASVAGASSVAVFASSSLPITFRRTKLEAGAGGAGSPGTPGAAPAILATGKCAASGEGVAGGKGGTFNGPPALTCNDNAQSGEPLLGTGGAGGAADTLPCTNGGNGSNGVNGANGPSGTGATKVGTLSAAGVFTSGDGTDGTFGYAGGGGGGGGCANGAGGRGGNGACGSGGGGRGTGAGASIAVMSLGTPMTFESCLIVTAAGAPGGAGGGVLPGATGGSGAPSGGGCGGGNGASGGTGGVGGGGAGGLSVGVVFTAKAPNLEATTTLQIGAAGPGGGPPSAMGINGVSAPTLGM